MDTKQIFSKITKVMATVISLGLIFSAVMLTILNTYKPTNKVTINGQFVGYFIDEQQFDEKYNILLNEKKEINKDVKVYLSANPVFEKTYVKDSVIEEENIYTNLRAQLKTEYTVYAVYVNNKKQMTFDTKDNANLYAKKVKDSATKVETKVKSKIVEEMEELTTTTMANAIVKDIVAKTKPVVVPKPVVKKPVVKKPYTSYNTTVTSSRGNTATSANAYGIWPTTSRYVSCPFGGYYGHTGTDIAGRYGDPNRAYKSGKVIFAGWANGYGYLVKIDHGNGIQSYYAHNSKLLVRAGQYVSQGTTVGLQGSTGNSSGTHLHFEIRLNGRAVNAYNYIR